MRLVRSFPFLLLASLLVVGAAVPSAQARPRGKQYSVPTAGSGPLGIAAGPDGALWFTEQSGNRIGRITTGGVFTEFPTSSSSPLGIAAGPDGAG
jgi:streptogramin lyase